MRIIKKLLRRMFPHLLHGYSQKIELENKLLMATSAMNASKAARSTFKNLWDAEVRVFSQWGEDGILNYLFDIAGIVKPRIIEFGAGNFTECNSRFAAEYRNASIYAVDIRGDLIATSRSLEIF